MPIFNGTAGNDVLIGTDNKDTLSGNGGNDLLRGLAGDDYFGAAPDYENDTGSSTIGGGAGDDRIEMDGGNDFYEGGAGSDTLRYWAFLRDAAIRIDLNVTTAQDTGLGRDVISGIENLDIDTLANCRLVGNALANRIASSGDGRDYLGGGAGDDTISAKNGGDTLMGGIGNDHITAEGAGNVIDAGDGNDTLILETITGANTVNLGAGTADTLELSDIDGLQIHLGRGTINGSGSYRGMETLKCSFAADLRVTGSATSMTYDLDYLEDVAIAAGTGNDTFDLYDVSGAINCGAGNDFVHMSSSSAHLFGGDGNDTLEANFLESVGQQIDGGAGDDMISSDFANYGAGAGQVFRGGTGNDILDLYGEQSLSAYGDGGDDRIDCNVSLDSSETAQRFVARLDGGDGNDTITAYFSDAPESGYQIVGGEGRDSIVGSHGADLISGGLHADTLAGGRGNDIYHADGSDVIVENEDGGVDQILVLGNLIMADNIEFAVIPGGAGLSVRGNDMANIIRGNWGANVIDGGSGFDRIYGGKGADTLKGGFGGDIILAGSDTDRDVITFHDVRESRHGTARDTILEFDTARDVIDLRRLDAHWGGTDDAFTLSAGPARNAVWLIATSTGTVLRADLNGDARQDFEVLIAGATDLGDNLLL